MCRGFCLSFLFVARIGTIWWERTQLLWITCRTFIIFIEKKRHKTHKKMQVILRANKKTNKIIFALFVFLDKNTNKQRNYTQSGLYLGRFCIYSFSFRFSFYYYLSSLKNKPKKNGTCRTVTTQKINVKTNCW